MTPSMQRALLLLQQGRHDLAENELRVTLAVDPDNGAAHSMLAICQARRQAYEEAQRTAQQGVHLAPDDAHAHYALAFVLFHKARHEESQVALFGKSNRYQEAAAAIAEAIRLEPDDADYFSLKAAILLAEKNWPSALDAAENGLKTDPEHVNCVNIRAMALVQLGRRDEAGATIGEALRHEPDNALSHANQGWAFLHQGQPRKALEHFREALRLDPELEWAQHGIVEALKARNFLYRWMLAYFLFMSRLSVRQQWGIIIGGYFLMRFLGFLSKENPENPALALIVLPLQILLILFVLLSWTASHLFNLALRLDPFGRYVLSRDQILGANAVGSCLLLAILMSVAAFWLGNETLGIGALGCLGLMIPVGGTFHRQGRARLYLGIYTGLLAAAGAAGLALSLVDSPLASGFGGLFAVGIFVFGWIANAMATR
jgi:tetratricopeptide (TPR) repeat protein